MVVIVREEEVSESEDEDDGELDKVHPYGLVDEKVTEDTEECIYGHGLWFNHDCRPNQTTDHGLLWFRAS